MQHAGVQIFERNGMDPEKWGDGMFDGTLGIQIYRQKKHTTVNFPNI